MGTRSQSEGRPAPPPSCTPQELEEERAARRAAVLEADAAADELRRAQVGAEDARQRQQAQAERLQAENAELHAVGRWRCV